jgi:hypothetical protein
MVRTENWTSGGHGAEALQSRTRLAAPYSGETGPSL